MKMIRVNHKQDWGMSIKFYNFSFLKRIDYSEKFSTIKVSIDVDVIEGQIENFDIDKFSKFAISDEKMIFEIYIG